MLMSHQEVQELKKIIRAKQGAGPFAPEVRQRLQAFLRARWEEGDSLQSWADELGLSRATAGYWRSKWGPRSSRETALRVVEVIDERPIDTVTVHGPSGTRVDGLTLEEVAELWRRMQ